MSAYAALISLKNTIHDHILHSFGHRLVHLSLEIIQMVYKELQPLQDNLERLDSTSKSRSRKKVNALDGRIKETVWKFEDLLEYSLVSLQSGEGERERDVLLFSIDDIDSFIYTLKDMKEEYIYEVDNMPEDEDENESCISSSTSSAACYGGTKSKMIGLSDQPELIKRILLMREEDWGNILLFGYALTGMAKTTLAREIYEDPETMSYFDFRLWITLGRKSSPQLNQVSRTILGKLKGDEKCLIVLDDVWETHQLDSLLTSLLGMENRGTRILLTARDQNVITYVRKSIRYIYDKVVRFLNEEESKGLLCHKVFGENIICPRQLEKAARKIAKKCEGLPLTIVTVADLLTKALNTDPEYWEDVAEERNSVFKDAYTQMSKVLFPSYDYLPQRFKMLFLFMAVFPRDYEIPPSKIINMLTAEGWFLHQHYSPENSNMVCLEELCAIHKLVLFKPQSSALKMIKTCRLHSAWRHLCREAQKNKFYHVLNRLVDAIL